MLQKKYVIIFGMALFILLGTSVYFNPSTTIPAITTHTVTQVDFINMTEDQFYQIKEKEILGMLVDTAKVYGINPYIFCGLSYHESDRFHQAHKKRIDSNHKYSYGLFQVQMETAKLYDKNVSETQLLTPAYNAHMAALIFTKNLSRYGSYDLAIAAHNAGTIHDGKIQNTGFVKEVYASTGVLVAKYDSLLWKIKQ